MLFTEITKDFLNNIYIDLYICYIDKTFKLYICVHMYKIEINFPVIFF